MALESVKRDLQLSRKDSQELTDQLNQLRLTELNMRLEGVTGISKQKSIEAFSRQLSELAKEASGSADSTAKVTAVASSYNEILLSLKKELPTDPYVQTTKTVNTNTSNIYIETTLRTSIPQLKAYLEQRYLK